MKTDRASEEFKEQALIKVRGRGEKSVRLIAEELNMREGTLRKWIGIGKRKEARANSVVVLPSDMAAASWSAAQRLLALNETHALTAPEVSAWCREKGLFEHQLQAWREAFCGAAVADSRESKTALRDLQVKHDKLQRELNRKEKALAEAAALLVLQKKYQALWEGEER
jgi:transposase-like protein